MKRWMLATTILFVITIAAIPACTHAPVPSSSAQSAPEALETKRLLAAADAPQRDLIDLVARYGDGDLNFSRVARDEPWGFEIGDRHDFWVQDKGRDVYHRVTGALVYETPHVYWFLFEGLAPDREALSAAAERFEAEIYPTNRRVFGPEWTPGVDGDPHLVILLSRELGGGVSAYQNSLDEVPQAVFPFSNEMEMVTAAAEGVRLDDLAFACDLAHEFQHVIQWTVDRDEKTWLNELFGLLACPLNGLEAGYNDLIVEAFAEDPDIQLNVWGTEADHVAAQYGASWLFGVYFLQHFGEQGVRSLAADAQNGLNSVDNALDNLDAGINGDDLFADWLVANYLDDPDLDDGRYGYRNLDLPPIKAAQVIDAGSLPVEIEATVNQFAADYVVLKGPGAFEIDFSGEVLVRPVPAEPHSGRMVWWAGRKQESDAMLTREFDLTGLAEATLTFYTWYEIEEGFDYAYVAVSTDGRQWTALSGQTTSTGLAKGVNLGPGYTGRSEGWLQENVDLTPYAGQRIQLRFEYVTDDGPVRPGFLLDDIAIPELDYQHDAEADDGGWLADGFLRQANILPQAWLLQLIAQRDDQVSVERLALKPDGRGVWTIELGPGETAVLAISGLTRDTGEAAVYGLRVTEPTG